MVAASHLGSKTFFSGKVADDSDGDLFISDLNQAGVDFHAADQEPGTTGKCLVMVTEDAERTMNTFLGASETLSDKEIDKILDKIKIGGINFHPSFLPYNRGRHSAFWGIVKNTKLGASAHWLTSNFDSGDIKLYNTSKVDIGRKSTTKENDSLIRVNTRLTANEIVF